jgi:acyl-CoA dehydrogenase
VDFQLTKEQKDIRQAARDFAEKEIRDIAREYDQKEEFPVDLWKKACDLGFVGVYIDEAYQGPGLGYFEAALIMEQFWRVDPGCGCILLTSFGAELIQNFGTEEQKRKYIPPIPQGKAIMGAAITEPDAGSDIFGVTTSTAKDGDAYAINGTKMFITNGSLADYLAVYCLTNPDAKSRYERYSFFIVEKDLWPLRGCSYTQVLSGGSIRLRPRELLEYQDGNRTLYMALCRTTPLVFPQRCSRQTGLTSCNCVVFGSHSP